MKGRKKQAHKKRRLLGTALLVSVLAVLLSGDPPASALPEQTALPETTKQEESVRARVLELAPETTIPPETASEPEKPEDPAKPETMLVPESDPVEDAYFADTVFLGDSRTEGFHLYSGLKEGEYLYAVGATVESVFTKDTQETEGGKVPILDALAELDCGKVYIMLGANELGWPRSEAFHDQYGKVIDRIREDHPDAEVVIQSILPVSAAQEAKGSYVNNRRIQTYNTILEELALEKECPYLDVKEAVTGEDGCLRPELTTDGVHLNTAGCREWLDYLRTHAVS